MHTLDSGAINSDILEEYHTTIVIESYHGSRRMSFTNDFERLSGCQPLRRDLRPMELYFTSASSDISAESATVQSYGWEARAVASHSCVRQGL